MRFISQFEGYGTQVRVQRQRAIDGGGVEVLQPGLYIKFTPVHSGAMLYENERHLALEHFNFRGQTQDVGEAIPTDPIQRLSVFDTEEAAMQEAWSADDKALVENHLSGLAVSTPQEVLLISDTPVAAPFPNYNQYAGDPTALVVRLIEDGHDLEVVLHYELVFGPRRPEIVAALEEGVKVGRELTVAS